MKKIMIIGSGGAGKSTLGRKLKEILKIPLIHLDQEYWHADWVESDKETWRLKVEKLSDMPTWIMDGNYGGTMDIRLNKADTIIFMDYPTIQRLWRVFTRTLRYRKSNRPDMPLGCEERFERKFFHYIAFYNKTRKPTIMKKLVRLKDAKRVVILKNDTETARFLSGLNP